MPKKKYPSKNFVTVHIASLLIRIDDTKTMCTHMKSASKSPEALCARSSLAGQRLLRGRSVRPTSAMSGTPCSIVCFLSVGFGGSVAFERALPQRQRFAAARVPWS